MPKSTRAADDACDAQDPRPRSAMPTRPIDPGTDPGDDPGLDDGGAVEDPDTDDGVAG